MTPQTTKTAPKANRPALIAGVVVIVLLLAAPLGYLAAMNDRIMPGVTLSGIALGGMTKDEAAAMVNAAVSIYKKDGLKFKYFKKNESIDTATMRKILSIDNASGLAMSYAVGHEGNILERLASTIDALRGRRHLYLPYTLDAAALKSALRQNWNTEESPVSDARLVINVSGDVLISTRIVPDQSGFEFDYDRAVGDARAKIVALDPTPVALQPARTNPTITAAAANEAKNLVPLALSLAPLSMSVGELKWTLTMRELAPMLEVYLQPGGASSLRLNTEAAQKYFKTIAADYDIASTSTRYEIDPMTNKMAVFEPGKNGRKIAINESVAALSGALEKQLSEQDGKTGFNIIATTDKSRVVSQSAADLGINEVIGVGVSDFSGSSTNRIKNIAHGSTKLNGILIAPGEEFSAIKALDPVTLEDGYFSEQIILGDKIEPAVGGGLCQIGTTLFRMAMNSGLPITERQNHSLVVHYYSDPTNGNPGTDATLYGPHPDLRFTNNTGRWLLITTAINVKTKQLTYTLWGTADGRRGSYSLPQVINWIPAPTDVQNVNDPTLPVGAQKCQNAFRGANTTFTYTIVNPDGTTTARNFNSHYRALPKICANGTGTPGTKLPNGTVVPPAPKILIPNPLAPVADTNTPLNNIVLPPEAAIGN